MQEGRFWNDSEDQRHAHVCVLGHDTAEELFGSEDPIGKEVNVATGLYTVIGVVEKRKQPFGSGKNPADNGVYFPLGTFHNLYPEIKDMYISVKYDDPKNKSLVEEEIREMLRIRRKVKVEASRTTSKSSGPIRSASLWDQLTGRPGAVHDRGLQRGPDGGRRGGDEHHAGLGHRTHPRDRRTQGHRRHQDGAI